MASTRSRLYTATTRPRKTAREPSALAQVRKRGRRAPPLARAPPALPQVRQQERLRVPLQAPRVHEQGRPPATIRPELAPEKRALLEQPPQAAIAPRAGTASFTTRSSRAKNYPTPAAPPGSFQRRLC